MAGVCGATAMTMQIVLLRELMTVFQGNELTFSVILCVWLIGGASGGWAGAAAARRIRSRTPLALLHAAAGIGVWGALVWARLSRVWLGYAPEAVMTVSAVWAVSAACLLPPAFLVSLAFTVWVDIGSRRNASPLNPTAAYLAEAAGAGIGGLALGIVMLFPVKTVYLLAPLSAVWLWTAWHGGAIDAVKRRWSVLALAATGAALIIFATAVDHWSRARQWRAFDILASVQSRYGYVLAVRRDQQISFYENGLLINTHPDPETYESTVHAPCAAQGRPRRILVLGDSAPGIVRELAKYRPDHIDLVELDPRLHAMKNRLLRAADAPGIHFHAGDGRRFVKTDHAPYDVIILAMPEPHSLMINRFYTRECFAEMERILAPDGVLGITLPGIGHYVQPELADLINSIRKAAADVFPRVVLLPLDQTHMLAGGADAALDDDAESWTARLEPFNAAHVFFNAYRVPTMLTSGRKAQLQAGLDASDARMNRDLRPIAQFYALQYWTAYAARAMHPMFRRLRSLPIACWLVPVFCWHLFLILLRRPGAAVINTVFWTGFSEFAYQLILLLGYQSLFGHAYHGAAFIFALFMIGLVGGSGWSRTRRDEDRLGRELLRVQYGIVLYPVLPAVLLAGRGAIGGLPPWAGEMLFASLAGAAGFFGGLQFPLAQRFLYRQRADAGWSTGTAYGFDLAGACLGALTAGGFLISLYGILPVCLLLVLINGMSLAALWRAKADKFNT